MTGSDHSARRGVDGATGSRRGVVLLALSWLVVATLGLTAGWLLAFRPLQVDLEPDRGDASYPMQETSFADARSVTLSFERTERSPLLLHASGTVTSFACTPGGKWASGDTPITISGRTVIVLATPVPLYRDLRGGESGKDVRALQSALTALGYTAGDSGRVDWATRNALARLRHDKGLSGASDGGGVLFLSETMWLPVNPTVTATCDAQLGGEVASGDAAASSTSTVLAIDVDVPPDLVAGDRLLTLGEVRVPLASSENKVRDAKALAALVADPAVAHYLALADDPGADPPMQPTATLALQTPIEVYSTPPSSLTSVTGNSACVVANGRPQPVEIVASSLGITYIRFPANAHVPQAVLIRPEVGRPCN